MDKNELDKLWSKDLLTKLIIKEADHFDLISKKIENNILKQLVDCDEVKNFQPEDKKKIIKNKEKVLSSTFSTKKNIILSADNNDLNEDLKDIGVDLPDSVSADDFSDLYDAAKPEKSNVKSLREKAADQLDSLKRNKLAKFVFDVFFVGLGRMQFTKYMPDLTQMLRNNAKLLNSKYMNEVKKVSKDDIFKVMDKSLKLLENKNVNPKETIEKISKNLVIEDVIDLKDEDKLQNDVVDNKVYMVKENGKLQQNDDKVLELKAGELIQKDRGTWEIVKQDEDEIDLFNSIMYVFYTLITDPKYTDIIRKKFSSSEILSSLNLNNTSTFDRFAADIKEQFESNLENVNIKRSNVAKKYLSFYEEDKTKNNFVYAMFLFIKTIFNINETREKFEKLKDEDFIEVEEKDVTDDVSDDKDSSSEIENIFENQTTISKFLFNDSSKFNKSIMDFSVDEYCAFFFKDIKKFLPKAYSKILSIYDNTNTEIEIVGVSIENEDKLTKYIFDNKEEIIKAINDNRYMILTDNNKNDSILNTACAEALLHLKGNPIPAKDVVLNAN